MDVFEVTPKKLFLLKLRNEPITLDVTDADEEVQWATKEQLKRLWDLGVLVRMENRKVRVTHDLASLVIGWSGKPEWDHTPAGTVLGR
jgi:hypothetical protein